MTLQEAIKSGKTFKRKPWAPFSSLFAGKEVSGNEYLYRLRSPHQTATLSVEDILADDWEVDIEEEKVELSFSEIRAAVNDAVCESSPYSLQYTGRSFDDVLKKTLGFKL